MLKKIFYLLLFLPTCFIISCEDVQVTPNGMGIRIVIDSTSTSQSAGSIQIDEAYMRISEIEFEGELTDDEEIELESSQTVMFDLLTGQANPSLNYLVIPAGLYEEFELEVQGADDGGTVFYVRGSFTDSLQNQTLIELDIREAFSLELEWENYQVDSTRAFGATFLINPAAWIANISLQDLQSADRDSNGVVVISPNSNTGIYSQLIAVIPEGIEWEWDDD